MHTSYKSTERKSDWIFSIFLLVFYGVVCTISYQGDFISKSQIPNVYTEFFYYNIFSEVGLVCINFEITKFTILILVTVFIIPEIINIFFMHLIIRLIIKFILKIIYFKCFHFIFKLIFWLSQIPQICTICLPLLQLITQKNSVNEFLIVFFYESP